jgi:hypothetical protein
MKKVKLSLCLIKHYAIKTYGGVDVKSHIFLTPALVGEEWSASCSGPFTSGTHLIGDWVGLRAGLDVVEKILDSTGTQTLTPQSSSP